MPGSISSKPMTPTTSLQKTATAQQLNKPKGIIPPAPPAPKGLIKTKPLTPTSQAPIDVKTESLAVNKSIDESNPSTSLTNAKKFESIGITPSIFQQGKNALKPISQRQVLNVGSDTTVVESGRSVRLAQGGTQFGIGIELKPGGQLDIVGHGSTDGKTVGGKTPQQLAKQIKDSGVTQLAVLDLKSCHSSAFKADLQQCLDNEGIQVGQIKTYEGTIAVGRKSGNVLQGGAIVQIGGHDGTLPRETDVAEPAGDEKLVDKWSLKSNEWNYETDRAKDDDVHFLNSIDFDSVRSALNAPKTADNQELLKNLGIALNQRDTGRFSNVVVDKILRKMDISSVSEGFIREKLPVIMENRESAGKSTAHARMNINTNIGKPPSSLIPSSASFESGGRLSELGRNSDLVHFDLGNVHNDRSTDAEAHILRRVDGALMSNDKVDKTKVTGTIEIITDRKTCVSCIAMCCDFKNKYPNVDLKLSFYNDVDTNSTTRDRYLSSDDSKE